MGKSSLACRFMDKSTFVEDHVPTIVDNYSRSVGKLDYDGIEREITL